MQRFQERILIAGASTRAAAESAAHAGWDVTAIDAYADLDQHHGVRAFAVQSAGGSMAHALVRASREIEVDKVVYLSPFENHPSVLAELARGRHLLGNGSDVLRRVRDPLVVSEAFRARGFDAPRVIVGSERIETLNDVDSVGWLIKPIRSGGGHGVRERAANELPGPGWYLQEQIDGWPGSITFVACQGQCRLLAVSRQIVGAAAFGAEGYRYCGSLIVWGRDSLTEDVSLRTQAHALATAATQAFGLVGVNGIDVIVRDGMPLPIEINPRWSSSMELVDRANRIPVMKAHVDACEGSLVDDPIVQVSETVTGKAILFARSDVVMPDTTTWLGNLDVRDIPRPHQRIARGQPICTVFAEGSTPDACEAALVRRAADVYALLEETARA